MGFALLGSTKRPKTANAPPFFQELVEAYYELAEVKELDELARLSPWMLRITLNRATMTDKSILVRGRRFARASACAGVGLRGRRLARLGWNSTQSQRARAPSSL